MALGWSLAACGGSGSQGAEAGTGAATEASGGVGTTTTGGADTSEGSGTVVDPECEPTEESIRATIIEPACATMGCHDAMSAAGGLDLSGPDLVASLAGIGSGTCDGEVLLVPGEPLSSFFFDKLQAEPACGGSMPVGQMLSPAQIDCVAGWIEQASGACETCGGTTCVELESSVDHCGECGRSCPDGVACISAECACPQGTEPCGDACVDIQSDPLHCGGCDSPCDGGLFCLAGGCTDDCAGLTECTGACVDTDTNPLHCGGCDAPCGEAEVCTAGQCGCDAPPTSYAADVESFIVAECASAGCHRPMGPIQGAEGLNLAAGAGYDGLVEVPSAQCGDRLLVEPGSPGSSYLYDKVLGINLCQGTAMPKSGPGLSPGQLQTISDWICSGAAP